MIIIDYIVYYSVLVQTLYEYYYAYLHILVPFDTFKSLVDSGTSRSIMHPSQLLSSGNYYSRHAKYIIPTPNFLSHSCFCLCTRFWYQSNCFVVVLNPCNSICSQFIILINLMGTSIVLFWTELWLLLLCRTNFSSEINRGSSIISCNT